MKLRLFEICLVALVLPQPLRAAVTLQAYGEIAPDAKDALGDTLGGLGSAAAYDARTRSLFLMPDRGAGDGSIDYRPRCYRVAFARNASRPDRLDLRLAETLLFRDPDGRTFSGLLPNQAASPRRGPQRCLDPEAIAVAPDGTLYVSDEYGPSLFQFDRSGRQLREIPLPDWYRPRSPQGATDYRAGKALASGREENRGGEAMDILPDGKHAVVILQSALLQDGGKPAGTSRILVLELRTGKPVAEYAYAFANPAAWKSKTSFDSLSVNDLSVVSDHEFLVLERDDLGRGGPLNAPGARYKAVWLVDVRGATNLLRLPGTPYSQSPADPGFKPLRRDSDLRFARKTLLFNLPNLTSQLGIPAGRLAAKWEGLTLIPPWSRNAFHLVMTADNDFLNPTLTFAGRKLSFPRAQDAVPTQVFELMAGRP